jgi:hypothetical protein
METCSRCRGIRVHDPVETPFTMAWNTQLAMAQIGKADYLVSGDQRGVLTLLTHGSTHIVRAREMIDVLGIKPPSAPAKRKRRR